LVSPALAPYALKPAVGLEYYVNEKQAGEGKRNEKKYETLVCMGARRGDAFGRFVIFDGSILRHVA